MVPYDSFREAFLNKVTEYGFPDSEYVRNEIIDGYMKRSMSEFMNVCKYDLLATADDVVEEFDIEIDEGDLDEILDIISEGMIVQWIKPRLYHQENLENILNTKDFNGYSPANLLDKIRETHKEASGRFVNMMREYSYNHGKLTDLHL